jgi:RNase adapter protein RapZ
VIDVVLITGLSGAGRSQAADVMEDLGWSVVDNLPTPLVDKIVELAGAPGSSLAKLALVVGAGPHQSDILGAMASVEAQGHRVRIIFLDAATPELVRRYESTRRRHPLDDGSGGVLAAIERERESLQPVKAEADLVIDTTELNVHQLKARLIGSFPPDQGESTLQVALMSFGYKHGLPLDADIVMDVRFLPNPYWDESLRQLSGLDERVRSYVLGSEAMAFLEALQALLRQLLPAYAAEGKSYLTVAIGCTGGRHRSVAIVERLGAWLREAGYPPRITHRDLDRLGG